MKASLPVLSAVLLLARAISSAADYFENTSKNPLKVFGVGEGKEGARIPASARFQYKLKSAWKAAGSLASGLTAPTLVTLAPGERRILQIPLGNLARLSATGRVGLRGQRGDEVLWSAPIEPQAFLIAIGR